MSYKKPAFLGGGRGRGRGRGTEKERIGQQNFLRQSQPWGGQGQLSNHSNSTHTRAVQPKGPPHAKQNSKNEDDWKNRDTARKDRLEMAEKIKQQSAAKFNDMAFEDSDSSDEEIQEDAIVSSAMKSYQNHLQDKSCDLASSNQHLADLLQSGATSCLICIASVKRQDAVWSCVQCYCIFHIQCIQKWSRQETAPKLVSTEEVPASEVTWDCPKCRRTYHKSECPTKYLCFCKKEENPTFDPWCIPHSCGQQCGKRLNPDCGHDCLLLCHPGPCPPCPKTVKVKCHCGSKGPATKRCSAKDWSCGKVCERPLSCGHHTCQTFCHPGDCPPCPKKSIQPCLCGKSESVRECAKPLWQCDKICGNLFCCGHHTCEKQCHGGPCGNCSRSGLRTCPCGKTSLQLPCTEDIPACEDTCGKLLACGRHYCTRKCHRGACETCRHVVTKNCRCGKNGKEVPCCLEYTCDLKCNRVKECGRHSCKRKCCDGKCPPCELTCNRTLPCGNHKCPAPCHKGMCFPCPLNKNVSCFCGAKVLTVVCGKEKTTRPPKCKNPCKNPSTCHHEKRENHKCHFGPCPNCRQKCSLPLKGCDHVCQEECHDHIPAEKPKTGFRKPWEQQPEPEEKFVPKQCPPCKAPVRRACFGEHEVSEFPCSQVKPFSCLRPCSRTLKCGNHSCQRECHIVSNVPSDSYSEAGKECTVCEEPCLKSRPEGCSHPCRLPCHPDPCPECRKFFKKKCHCGLIMIDIKCSEYTNTTGEELSVLLSCKNQCPRLLPCGHRCLAVCHPGQCPDPEKCDQKSKVQCPCKRKKKDYPCSQVTSGEATLECDSRCKEILEKKEKEVKEKEEARKAEEMKRQQDELERYERKKQGRKRKHRPVVEVKDDKTFLNKYMLWIVGSVVIMVAAVAVALFFQ